jgi:hypothetical protein
MRPTLALITTLACAQLACGPDCPNHDTATDGYPDDIPIYEDDSGGCCYPLLPGVELDICETHPFGPGPGCGGIERPQTTSNCYDIARLNPGLCASTYVECREAIRDAPCGTCPPACAGIVGACAP